MFSETPSRHEKSRGSVRCPGPRLLRLRDLAPAPHHLLTTSLLLITTGGYEPATITFPVNRSKPRRCHSQAQSHHKERYCENQKCALHSLSPPFPCSSFSQRKTGHPRPQSRPTEKVAGCTTGSVRPWCPQLRDESLRLYFLVANLLRTLYIVDESHATVLKGVAKYTLRRIASRWPRTTTLELGAHSTQAAGLFC